MLLQRVGFPSFCGQVVFHYVNVPQLFYPLICWWALELHFNSQALEPAQVLFLCWHSLYALTALNSLDKYSPLFPSSMPFSSLFSLPAMLSTPTQAFSSSVSLCSAFNTVLNQPFSMKPICAVLPASWQIKLFFFNMFPNSPLTIFLSALLMCFYDIKNIEREICLLPNTIVMCYNCSSVYLCVLSDQWFSTFFISQDI